MKITDEIKASYTYEGRLNRFPYILTTLSYQFFIIISILILTLGSQLLGELETSLLFFSPPLFIVVFCFAFFYCIFFVWFTVYFFFQTIRRLHDLNMTGWLVFIRLLLLIPYSIFTIGIVFIGELLLFILDGTEGTNNYGEDPKNR